VYNQVYFSERFKGTLILMDTDREKEIKLGREYPYGAMQYAQCIIHENQAEILNVKLGDILYGKMVMTNQINALIAQYNTTVPEDKRIELMEGAIFKFPCRISQLVDTSYGKISEAGVQDVIFMELQPFLGLISDYLPPDLHENDDFITYLRSGNTSLNQFADLLVMTLPDPRISYYESSNYELIQQKVTSYANEVQ